MPTVHPDAAEATRAISIRYVPIAALHPASYNPRVMPDDEMEALVDSIRSFGLVDPILVRRGDAMVVGGHQRLEAAKCLGLTEVPVVELDLSDEQAKALNVALKKIGGTWDLPKLAELLASLPSDYQALTGFDEAELKKVARDADAAIRALTDGANADAIPETPTEPVTRPGDLWLLGRHRLLCGDSTNSDDVARLMKGEKAVLLASDPPYLVNYQGGNHPQSFANRPEVRDKHWDDYKDPETGVAFFEAYLRTALDHCVEGVAVYQWHASRRQPLLEEAWRRVGLLAHQQIIWAKARPVLTHSHYLWAHEPCIYGWVEGHPPLVKPPSTEPTVWEIDQQGSGEGDIDHPTVKPVEVMARPIRFHTAPGDLVMEPFSGSGTQIVAAEQLGRRCYAMEIAPAFCDVAVTRWERLTGQKAVREVQP